MTRGLADKRVLVIADEYIIALNLASELADRGTLVIGPVGIVESALDAIKNTDLDGAILNINLRGREAFSYHFRIRMIWQCRETRLWI
jgi:two-component SAPR family response regulator